MKALYFVLDLDYAIPFLLGIIWKPWILSNMSFFAWKAFMGMVFDFGPTSRKMLVISQ